MQAAASSAVTVRQEGVRTAEVIPTGNRKEENIEQDKPLTSLLIWRTSTSKLAANDTKIWTDFSENSQYLLGTHLKVKPNHDLDIQAESKSQKGLSDVKRDWLFSGWAVSGWTETTWWLRTLSYRKYFFFFGWKQNKKQCKVIRIKKNCKVKTSVPFHPPLCSLVSSVLHEGLVLPLVGEQLQEHLVLPLIEAVKGEKTTTP